MEPKISSAIDTFEASQDINRVVYSDIKPHKEASEKEGKKESLCTSGQQQQVVAV